MSMKHVSSESFQLWETPRPLREQFVREFGLKLDVAASSHNAVCEDYFDEVEDGLMKAWDVGLDENGLGGAFCNPPYEDVGPWLEKAREEVDAGRCGRTVFLVPWAAGVTWFTAALMQHEVHAFDGRINFDLPAPEHLPEKYRDGRKRKSAGGGNALIIVERGGLVGLTAIRSRDTGEIVFDYLDVPVRKRVAA